MRRVGEPGTFAVAVLVRGLPRALFKPPVVSRFAAAARDRRGVAGLACARRVRERTRTGHDPAVRRLRGTAHLP